MSNDLKSTVNEMGDTVTQIIHFKDGIKRTFTGVITKSLKQGQFTKFKLLNGTMILINDENVLLIEVIPEENKLEDDKD